MRYTYHCALRWSDLDAYGHVNNARFLTLYEEARVALMFLGARARGLGSFADGVVIARHEVDYLRPVDYLPPAGAGGVGGGTPDGAGSVGAGAAGGVDGTGGVDGAGADPTPRVRVELWVEEVRAAQFTIAYELFTGDLVASRARSVCVPFDLIRKAPRRLSEAERAFLAPYTR